METKETYEDIRKVLTDIINRIGANNINIGIVTDVARLPRRIPKLGVWYLNSANDAKAILETLISDFALEENNSIGQYLYVYETEIPNPQILN